jgi:CDP-diacylglycerol--glycerol-3-phosphate 3-phosphatidyltransferase
MYHTSNLNGLRKAVVPKRVNEGWGLQHMKLYGFDDEVILSGANLSVDYFTNRQDRYHLYSSKQATDYFSDIHHALCQLSFRCEADDNPSGFSLSWPSDNKISLERDSKNEKVEMTVPSPLEDPAGYDKATASLFAKLIAPPSTPQKPPSTSTSLYPVLILPRAHNTELPAVKYLFSQPYPRGSSYLFTAGYFNPHPSITSSLLGLSSARPDREPVPGTVLTASPWANGFYGSKGVSGMLPGGYTILARRFISAVNQTCPPSILRLREWRLGTVGRPHGWTYHAKGLWFTLPGADDALTAGPSITLIGSSNYTVRSYMLDTEAGGLLLTRDPGLQAQLAREQATLLEHTREVQAQDLRGGARRVGLPTRIALWMVSAAGGSL